ncbi:BZ3500_MvSof-1268-A1-R1_Chr3-1g05929 [Microbotryum saponariae]|uniref:Vacuolar ATPase assembly protein VMA22 n=1 Tax=Microbotryum saponariae TaxID=289078 RepID=A0A2X0LJW1_9BASI|nr:BZ3500_MvSof-1268-A1-R1_Chr3-1g05929 [Microbotryum saponariae]SDA05119.1 BZ3501_MvSof-1269-A2-R1_Chr3-1g05599 [Microbotryum saponariae]
MSIHSIDIDHDELLDELLIEYLADIDLYQAAQERLQAALKQASLDLARSKLAVGAAKMSQDGHDLGQTGSNVAISIVATENKSWATGQASRTKTASLTENDTDRRSFAWTLGPSPPPAAPSPPSESTEPSPSTSLRSRSNTKATPTPEKSSNDSTPEKPTPSPRPLRRSPLLQFSAFPPTALRSAEHSWQKVLRSTVELTEAKYKLEASEDRVRKCKATQKQASSEVKKSH